MAHGQTEATLALEARDRLFERPLPHSLESERLLLGMMFLSEAAAHEIALTVAAEDFYLRAHQAIFRACCTVAARGDDLNPLLVGEELRREGLLEQVNGISFISDLTHGIPSIANVSPHVRLVKQKRTLRRLLQFCQRTSSAALDGEDDPATLVEQLEADLRELGATDGALARPQRLSERMPETEARYELMFHGASDALATGFPALDSRLTGGGLRPKQLSIIAARPSAGKSSLMLDIAANIAGAGRNVLIFSLEMGAEQLIDRLVSFESGVERWKIRGGIFNTDYERLRATLPRVGESPLWVDDRNRTLSRILHFSRELARWPETRPALVMIDYIQLVEGDRGRARSRNEEIGSVSRALKGLANELGIPVVALSQLSRDCEKQGREPELADLRDSGEIENDADIVIFLYGERPQEGAEFYARSVKCAKQREGALFKASLDFIGPFVSFRRRDDAQAQATHAPAPSALETLDLMMPLAEGEPDFPDPYPSSYTDD